MTWRPLLPWAVLVLAGLVGTAVCVVGLLRTYPNSSLTSRIGWAARIVMVWALVVVAAQPSTTTTVPVGTSTSNVDVLLVVDRTGSMAAEDWNGDQPRLDGVRADVETLVEALPGVRWSVLAWDSSAVRTLPFTSDAHALTSWVASLRQEITAYSGGSQIDRPLEKLTEIVADEAERRPEALQYVVILSDGESTLDGPWTSFRGLHDHVAGGAVLGYGTNTGGQMRSYDGAADPDPDAPWITDDSGAPAVSRIDEQVLTAVADQLEVPYLHRTGPDPADLVAWAEDLERVTKTEPGRSVSVYLAQTWPVAVLLALALAVEVVLAVPRRARRSR